MSKQKKFKELFEFDVQDIDHNVMNKHLEQLKKEIDNLEGVENLSDEQSSIDIDGAKHVVDYLHYRLASTLQVLMLTASNNGSGLMKPVSLIVNQVKEITCSIAALTVVDKLEGAFKQFKGEGLEEAIKEQDAAADNDEQARARADEILSDLFNIKEDKDNGKDKPENDNGTLH